MNEVERENQDTSRVVIIAAIVAVLLIHMIVLFILFWYQYPAIDKASAKRLEKDVTKPLPLLHEQARSSMLSKPRDNAQVIFYDPPPSVPVTAVPVEKDISPKKRENIDKVPIIEKITSLSGPMIVQQPDRLEQKKEEPYMPRRYNPFLPTYQQFFSRRNSNKLQHIGKSFVAAMDQLVNSQRNSCGNSFAQTQEELKLLSYTKKIVENIGTTFLMDNTWITLNHSEDVEVKALITINREGQILELDLQDPPKNSQLDRHIRELIYQASPFTKIPKHLNQNAIKVVYPIRIRAPEGSQRFRWVMTRGV